METAFRRASGGVEGLNRSVRTLGRVLIAAGIGLSIREVVQLADSYKLLAARVNIVSDNAEEGAATFRRLFEVAQETSGSLEGVVTVFQRLSISRKEIGATTDQLLQFTQNLQKLIVVSGVEANEARAALIQLSQGLASGTLRGDELRSVMEQMPVLARAIADEMGVTIGQFRQLAQEGKVIPEVVLRAVLNRTDQINRQFEKVPRTVGRATTELRNSFLQLVGFIDSGSAASTSMAASIDSIRDTIADPAFQQGAANFTASLVDGARFLIEHQEVLLGVLGAMGGARVGGLPGAAIGGGAGAVVGALSTPEITRLERRLAEARANLDKLVSDQKRGFWDNLVYGPFSKETIEKRIGETEKIIQDTAARINELRNATGGSIDPFNVPLPVGLPTPKRQRSKEVTDTLTALEFERAQLKRTNEEQFVYNALKKAKTDLSTADGLAVALVADALFREAQALDLDNKAHEMATDRIREVAAAKQETTRELETEIAGNRQLIEALKVSGTEYERQAAFLEIINKFKSEGIDLTEAETDAYRRLARILGEGREEIQRQRDAIKDAQAAGRDFARSIGTAFEDAVIRGDSLRSVLKGIADDILRIILRLTVTKPLENLLSGVIDSGLSGIFGGGAAGAGGGSAGVDSFNVPGFAHGGIVQGPMLATIGERMPEAVVPLPDGRSIPVRLAGASGPTINQSLNFSLGVAPTVRAELMALLPQIAEATLGVVQDSRARDPRGSGIR